MARSTSGGESLDVLLTRTEDAITALVGEYARLSRNGWIVTVILLGVGAFVAYQERASAHPGALLALGITSLAVILALRGLSLRIAIGTQGAAPRTLVHAIYRSVRDSHHPATSTTVYRNHPPVLQGTGYVGARVLETVAHDSERGPS